VPYKDPEKRKEYARLWIAERRKEWFDENGPCVDCGSLDELELDHVDPSQKVTHRIWSWSKERRDNELSKCVIRCRACHHIKSINNCNYRNMDSKDTLNYDQVCEIRRLFNVDHLTQSDIARRFNIDKGYVHLIVRNKRRVDA
jgi:hypothetical protein